MRFIDIYKVDKFQTWSLHASPNYEILEWLPIPYNQVRWY